MIPIYFLINALETALFTVYIMLDSSEKQQQVLFNLSPQTINPGHSAGHYYKLILVNCIYLLEERENRAENHRYSPQ